MERQMFKIWGAATVATSVLCGLQASGPPAAALDRHIQIINNTRIAIVELYLAQAGTGRWQPDLLGDEILVPTDSLTVDVDDGVGDCRFDMKTVFDDGTTTLRRSVNFCRTEGLAISYR
jgi:hypothetical protein